MVEQREHDSQVEPKKPVESGKKVHQTHFSVHEQKFRNDGSDNDYEWVDLGNGRWKRVRKSDRVF